MIVLFDSTVIGDRTPQQKAIYRKVIKATGLHFSHFGYCDSTVDECTAATGILAAMGYELKFFSGCFDPYLCYKK